MAVGLWDSSFKNAFHTLSYRFAAIILVILYSRGKGKELKDAEQGCIADTLTNKMNHNKHFFYWHKETDLDYSIAESLYSKLKEKDRYRKIAA